MRILIYGAGVLGSNLAAGLCGSGKDVTLLARGEWADVIERTGLVIDPVFSPVKRTCRLPVVRTLEKDDIYDVIFVVMRYTQLDSVIPVLADNGTENIVFVGNDLTPEKVAEGLPGKNVMFGFFMAAGHREKDRVVSISLNKMTVGHLKDAASGERFIREIFAGTKIRVTYQPNMGDYLLCHAAFVMPVAFACYHCGGDLRRIRSDRAFLNRIIDANIEGYTAIENAGHEILPESDKDYRSRKYRDLCYSVYKLMCSTVIGKICASDHALNAVEEMSALNTELKRFFDENHAEYPCYQEFERLASGYLDY